MKKTFISILPSTITSISILSGFTSLIFTSNGNFKAAAWAIIFAIFMDAMDGKVARLTKMVSKFGEEYDSLADTMSFGMAPAFLIYNVMISDGVGVNNYVALSVSFLIVLCGALRLARFNITEEKSSDFTGMPIPGAAGIIASYLLAGYKYGFQYKSYLLIFIAIWVSFLMVSNLPYFSGKQKKRGRANRKIMFLMVIAIALITKFHIEFFMFMGLLYGLYGPLKYIYIKFEEFAKNF